ncbi:unnamed protein product [Toxocara canis]|uniref:AAA_28 domain-containing protein n=1 Tax=Toxocara canis TaxID=6265 RepID=A0A183UD65_TOXCA|nr:unnamed protein product [Toxocara canis]
MCLDLYLLNAYVRLTLLMVFNPSAAKKKEFIDLDKSSKSCALLPAVYRRQAEFACSTVDIVASNPASTFICTERFQMTDLNVTASKRKTYKVVLTGGPCGGKTTGQDRLRTFFEGIGWKVYTVPEAATILLGGGANFAAMTRDQAYAFQRDLLQTMLQIESVVPALMIRAALEVFFNQANLSDSEHVLVICDRGAMDPSAYIDDQLWKKCLNELNLEQFNLREQRYDQLCFCYGAVDYYTLANNPARTESIEQAIEQDRLTRKAWLGHPSVDVIDNVGCNSFEDKILRLIAAVCVRIGLCTQDRLAFNSRKRKWLVIAIDESRMPQSEMFKVRHEYLCTENPEIQVRLRSRSQNGRATYTITTRQFIMPQPVETRMQLTAREYNNYRRMVDRSRATIHKERRCFMFQRQYFHVDIYTSPLPPSCEGKPLLILETYTTAPVGSVEPDIPDFITVEREITGEPAYSMYNIAKIDRKSLNI